LVETTLSPAAVRAALLDFSDRRPSIWPGLTPSLYEVYSVGETTAEVKEGTKLPIGALWAKEHYDWSDKDTISWTVVESNFCAPGSFVSATTQARQEGGTHILIHWERAATSLLGRLIGRVIVATKGKPLAAAIEKALRQPEPDINPPRQTST